MKKPSRTRKQPVEPTKPVEPESIGPYRFETSTGMLTYGGHNLTTSVTPVGKRLTTAFIQAMPKSPRLHFNRETGAFGLIPADVAKIQALAAMFVLPDSTDKEM